jgi:uncharacterized protein YndB with AHSA1/START domain
MTHSIAVPTGAYDKIVQEITIKAPAARIFAALTQPEQLLEWWAAEGKFRAIQVECDPRPGGSWSMRVEGACGAGNSCTHVIGRYIEVDPPRRLSFTWLREEESDPETLVVWDLEERGTETWVRVTHSGFTSERMRDRNNGWPIIQQLLKAFVEPQA